MARKLPWSAGAGATAKATKSESRTAVSDESKPVRTADSNTGAKKRRPSDEPAQLSPRRSKQIKTSDRTPSTSPPPAAPDVESMVPGFDNDDAYMTVEDEFQSIAQSFTAHLHRAEYKRLMHDTRKAPTKTLPEAKLDMSHASKHQLKQAHLSNKQQEHLSKTLRAAGARDDEDEEGVEEDLGRPKSDPWAGTSLAGLMRSSSQQKTSLVGLEKVSTSTKAARGFRSSNDNDVTPKRNISEFFGDRRGKGPSSKELILPNNGIQLSGRRSNDYRGDATGKQDTMRGSGLQANPLQTPDRPRRSSETSENLETIKPVSKSWRSRIDELDDFDDSQFDKQIRNKGPKGKEKLAQKQNESDEKDYKSRLDEVPVFMI